jgi:exopolyphosphatase/guanosine-5'-triphosphate,3'-diphosphate pyrophosphatase
MRYAAIDIGSNTFRLLIAEPVTENNSAPWAVIHYAHRIIRLGEGLHQSGELSGAGMERALQALSEFAAILARHHVSPACTLAVATAAMREAANGERFRDRVKAETGMEIRIIDGALEATTSLAGACAVLERPTLGDMLLFDIGGASTEFIRAKNRVQRHATSRKLGVVRLIEAHLHSDPPSKSDYRAMLEAATEHLLMVEAGWTHPDPPEHLVGTAGTVTTLAATELDLFPYDAKAINNFHMSKNAFFALRDRLLAMSHDERQRVRTIETGRGDLIIGGLAIIEAVMQRWNYHELIVVDAGLLEGAWLKVSQRLS